MAREVQNVSNSPQPKPLRALEIVVPEIRKALKDDNTELAMAYLPVVEWAVEMLGEQEYVRGS